MDTEELKVNIGIDASVFSDVELTGTLMEVKKLKESIFKHIGAGGSITFEPLMYKGVLYVGACDKNFYAIDPRTGKELWRFSANDIITRGAAAYKNIVIFGSYDGALYALDIETHRHAWEFKTNGPIYAIPLVHEGRVYFGSNDMNVYCLEAGTGEMLWKFPIDEIANQVAEYKGMLFFGHGKKFYCTDTGGKLLWKAGFTEKVCAFPALIYDDIIYIGCYDNNLYALNMNGKVVWRFRCSEVAYPPRLSEDRERIFFGSRDNCIYCLNRKTGKFIWKFGTNGFVWNIVVCNDRIYASSYDNNIYAISEKTGKLLWKFATNGPVNCSFADEHRIYFGSWDCNFYCIDHSGKLLWKFRTSMASPSKIELPEEIRLKSVGFVVKDLDEKRFIEPMEENRGEYGPKIEYFSGAGQEYSTSGVGKRYKKAM